MTPDDPRQHHPDDPGEGAPLSRDQLASALLDGVLSRDDAAEARRRPDVVARAAEMEAARAAIRDLPSPTAEARDQAVAAALAAFDAESTGVIAPAAHSPRGSGTPGGMVVERRTVGDLAARRRHTGRRVPRWLAAAAAVVVLGAASVAIVSSGGSHDDESASMSAEAGGDRATTASGDDQATDEPSSGGAESSTSGELAPAEVGDLGAFPSAEALLDQVDSLLGTVDDAGSQPAAPVDPDSDLGGAAAAEAQARLDVACPAGPPAPLQDPGLAVRLHGQAVVDGRDLDVWVLDTAGGTRVLAIDATCAVVVDRLSR